MKEDRERGRKERREGRNRDEEGKKRRRREEAREWGIFTILGSSSSGRIHLVSLTHSAFI